MRRDEQEGLPAIVFFATQKYGASGIQLTGLAGR